jgi:hypothetical protein
LAGRSKRTKNRHQIEPSLFLMQTIDLIVLTSSLYLFHCRIHNIVLKRNRTNTSPHSSPKIQIYLQNTVEMYNTSSQLYHTRRGSKHSRIASQYYFINSIIIIIDNPAAAETETPLLRHISNRCRHSGNHRIIFSPTSRSRGAGRWK